MPFSYWFSSLPRRCLPAAAAPTRTPAETLPFPPRRLPPRPPRRPGLPPRPPRCPALSLLPTPPSTTATALWTEWTTSRKTPPPVRVQLVSDNTPGQFAPVHIIPCVSVSPSAPAPADEVHGFWESRQCCMGNPRPGTAS